MVDTERPPRAVYRFDGFTLDLTRGVLLRSGGAEVPLRPKSFALLQLLVENAGRLLDRDTIMGAVWPDVFVTDDSITQCIRDIRCALGDEAQHLLRTVPRRGYLFAAEVSHAGPAAAVSEERPALILEKTSSQHPPALELIQPKESLGVKRRLTAILAADVVGYSRLMAADEQGTHTRLKALRRDFIEPKVAEHHGRIVKLMGDGALVEYASVVDAVQCAAEIQRGIAERNADVPRDRRIEFRIGINLGDVIFDGGDIYGDGVNIATRLEGHANPGGICLSEDAYRQVKGKVKVDFEDLGQRELKNIAEPMRIYRINLGAVTGSTTGPFPRPHNRASIAVLPFTNMSGDPEQNYFSDGITEDIITELSRFRSLFVIARNSSFRYKNQSPMVQDVGHQLGVEYVVEGSVRKAGSRIRVTVQLIDARTGGHVWAERYDRPLGDTFAIQDEITASIAARLGAAIERAEADAGGRKAPADFGAFDFYLQGRAKRPAEAKTPQLEARELFRKAVEIDPGFAPAYAELARTYYTEIALQWDPQRRAEALAKGFEFARKAVALDQTLPVAHLIMGDLYLRQHDYEEAVVWAERAIALNPNDPDSYAALANIKTLMGEPADALPLMRKAIDLDPNYPPLYDMYIGRAYLAARQPATAVPHLRRCTSRMPDHWPAQLFLAAAYGQLGQLADAGAALAAARRYIKLDSVHDYAKGTVWKSGPASDYVFEGLALAGLSRDDAGSSASD